MFMCAQLFVVTYEQMFTSAQCRQLAHYCFFIVNLHSKRVHVRMCVCVCVKDCEISLSPPAVPPCVLVGLSNASQRFHGVLEAEGGPLIYSRHTNTRKHMHTQLHPLFLHLLCSQCSQLDTNIKLKPNVVVYIRQIQKL